MTVASEHADALLFEEDHSSDDQSPLTEAEWSRVAAITDILPTIEATQEQKDEFAFEVISDLLDVIAYAQDKHKFPLQRKELLKAAKKAKTALAAFNELLVTSRANINGNLSAAHAMNPRITENLNIKDVLVYLDSLQEALQLVKSRVPKQRQNEESMIGQEVAAFLHDRFQKHFGLKPQSGKGRRPYGDTIIKDFDRLCEFLNNEYHIKISMDARSMAWKERELGKKKSPE